MRIEHYLKCSNEFSSLFLSSVVNDTFYLNIENCFERKVLQKYMNSVLDFVFFNNQASTNMDVLLNILKYFNQISFIILTPLMQQYYFSK